MDLELRKTNRQEQRPANKRLAQWRVTWLIEHSTSHQLLWCIDSFVLRNPPLRQAPKRQAVKKPFFHLNFPYFPIATTQIEPFKKAVFFRLHV